MFGKIAAAVIGDRIASRTKGMSGAKGALAGVAAATVVRRLSVPVLVALAAGGYAAKKLSEKNGARSAPA